MRITFVSLVDDGTVGPPAVEAFDKPLLQLERSGSCERSFRWASIGLETCGSHVWYSKLKPETFNDLAAVFFVLDLRKESVDLCRVCLPFRVTPVRAVLIGITTVRGGVLAEARWDVESVVNNFDIMVQLLGL